MLAGMVFDPSDEEIVSHYLPKLIQGEGMGEWQYLIEFYDIYSSKPSLLFEIDSGKGLPFIKSNQRFFFSHRQKISQKNANGKRPRRVVESLGDGNGSGGYWKSSTGEKPIVDELQEGTVLGYVNTLNFLEFKNEKKDRKGATKTSWLMHEYRLPGERFQEWVICKIKDLSRSGHDEYESVWLNEFLGKLTSPQGKSNDQDQHQPNLMPEYRSQTSIVVDPLMGNNGVGGSSCLHVQQSETTFVGETGQFGFTFGSGFGLECRSQASTLVDPSMDNNILDGSSCLHQSGTAFGGETCQFGINVGSGFGLECGSLASTLVDPSMGNNNVDRSSCLPLQQSESTFVGESGQFDCNVGSGFGQLESNALASNGVGKIMSNNDEDPFEEVDQLLGIGNSKNNELSKLLDELATDAGADEDEDPFMEVEQLLGISNSKNNEISKCSDKLSTDELLGILNFDHLPALEDFPVK